MRMRLTKGLERGDRWEEGQRIVTDGIKDDKGSESGNKRSIFSSGFLNNQAILLYDILQCCGSGSGIRDPVPL